MALKWIFRGFNYSSYYNGAYENDDSLNALAATGANAMATTLCWGIDPVNNTVYDDSEFTDPLTAEASMIRQGVAEGLTVLVKPQVDFENAALLKNTPYYVDDWRTYYNPGPAGSAGANSFFATYKTMLLKEAAVATANGAKMLSVGTELDQLAGPAYKHYWDDIISTVRAENPTLKLTYSADWDDAASPWLFGDSGLPAGTGNIATQISFASELDYFGLDAYAPLSNVANPTLQDLIDGWTKTPVNSGATAETFAVTGNQSLLHYFQSVGAAVGKPLLFTELGYENATDAAITPAVSATNVEDDALQARLYQAFFKVFSQSSFPALDGAFLYNWDPNASEVGPGSVAFSPQKLPALSTVDTYFAAPGLSAPATLSAPLDVVKSVKGVAIATNSTGSLFTVKLTAAQGVLSANGAPGKSALTITGSLAAVDAALATLTYEETASASDTIHITTSADAGPVASASVAVANDPAYPVVSFDTATQVSGATVAVSGSVNTANAGRLAQYVVNGAAGPTALVGADGSFSTHLTLPTGIVDVVSVAVTDAGGNRGATSPLMLGVSDGLTATFSDAHGDDVNLFNATSLGDTVNGSNGYVILQGAKARVNGGGDQIYTDGSSSDAATLTGTAGAADLFTGDNGAVTLENADVRVRGTQDVVNVAVGTANALAGVGSYRVNESAGTGVRLVGAAVYHVVASQARTALAPDVSADVTGAADRLALYAGAKLSILSGQQDVVMPGLDNAVADGGGQTLFRIGAAVDALKISDFGADAGGIIDLLNGVGGYATAGAAAAAVTSDNAGGALLSLGADGSIDFKATSPSVLTAAHFRIG